jgi:hypothetical protein
MQKVRRAIVSFMQHAPALVPQANAGHRRCDSDGANSKSSCSNREWDRSWYRCAGAGIAPAPRLRRSAIKQQSKLPVSFYPPYSCGMQRGRHCDDVFAGFPCSRISNSHRPGRPLAIRPTQGFYCPFDGRVCSGNRRRLRGKEPVCHGDLRTQNDIVRQVTLVMHCQSFPIAVEPHTPLLQDRLVRGEGGLVAPAE